MRDGRVARWLHIRQDRRAAHPGTDRSAWADGAGFPDGRWPFRTAWDDPSAQVGPFTPPPSRVWLPVGGIAGPSIARDGRGGLELRPSSLGWFGLWFGQDGNSLTNAQLSQAFQFVLDTLTRTPPLDFGVARPGLRVAKPFVSLTLDPLPHCCVALPRAPAYFCGLLVSTSQPFPLSIPSPRLAVLKLGVPRLSVCNPLLHACGSRGGRPVASTLMSPSKARLRPLCHLSSSSAPGCLCCLSGPRPPPSTKLTAQAGWRIGSE